MKKILLFLFCLPVFAIAQNHRDLVQSQKDFRKMMDTVTDILPVTDNVIMYTGVVNLDSTLTKAELFDRAKSWFVTTYKSANDVIQMNDKDAGILIGKGVFDVLYNLRNVSVYHTVKLYFKDGKYKYEITELSGRYYDEINGSTGDVYIMNNQFKKNNKKKEDYNIFLETVNYYVLEVIESLKTAMNKPIITKDF